MTFFRFNTQCLSDYDSFVGSFENALLFHSSKYLKFISDHLGFQLEVWGIKNSEDEILAVFAFAIKNGRYGKVLNSMPYYGSNGGVLYKDKLAAIALIDKWNSFKKDFASTTIIESPYINEELMGGVASCDYETVRVTHFNHLSSNYDTESLMNVYHYKTRNVVRKALKSGIEIIEDTADLETLYTIHKDNMAAIGGKPKDKIFFDQLPEYFRFGVDYKVFYANREGKKIAALLLFFFNKTVEYFTPVVVQEYRNLQPLSLLIHHTMLISGQEGYRYWNWGGSWESQHSLIHFKERWGGEIRRYKYFTSINNPEIFKATRSSIEAEYPGFFVIPYELLGKSL